MFHTLSFPDKHYSSQDASSCTVVSMKIVKIDLESGERGIHSCTFQMRETPSNVY